MSDSVLSLVMELEKSGIVLSKSIGVSTALSFVGNIGISPMSESSSLTSDSSLSEKDGPSMVSAHKVFYAMRNTTKCQIKAYYNIDAYKDWFKTQNHVQLDRNIAIYNGSPLTAAVHECTYIMNNQSLYIII